MVVTCAEVRLESSMCSAILIRMVLSGSIFVLAPGAKAGGAAVGLLATEGAAAGVAGAGAAGAPCARQASTSCLVMRPPAPVPLTRLRSILFSRAIFRTSGESGPDTSAAGSSAGGESGPDTSPAGSAAGGAGTSAADGAGAATAAAADRKSTRLNSSHLGISYAV